jgi:hypothetical protein
VRKLALIEYLKVPRNPETLSRSLLRKLHGGYRERPHEYISGDSFKAHCDLELNSDNWYEVLMESRSELHCNFRFFVPGAPTSLVSFEIVEFLKLNPKYQFPNVTLVLHNGDHFPSVAELEFASSRFNRIYSVNWLGNSPKVYPIPIGLENQGYLLNGVLEDYLRSRQKLMPLKDRPYKLLVCFSLHTNPIERSEALRCALKVSGVKVIDSPVTPKKYRELVRQSMYVLSPPGNGIDCHRTWEALFLGSIPIVKKSFWPFSKLQIGAKVIEDWSEVEMILIPEKREIVDDFFNSKYAKVDSWLRP